METTSTQWWTCAGCQVDVELDEAEHGGGCLLPCPDCAEPMAPWREWDHRADSAA